MFEQIQAQLKRIADALEVIATTGISGPDAETLLTETTALANRAEEIAGTTPTPAPTARRR